MSGVSTSGKASYSAATAPSVAAVALAARAVSARPMASTHASRSSAVAHSSRSTPPSPPSPWCTMSCRRWLGAVPGCGSTRAAAASGSVPRGSRCQSSAAVSSLRACGSNQRSANGLAWSSSRRWAQAPGFARVPGFTRRLRTTLAKIAPLSTPLFSEMTACEDGEDDLLVLESRDTNADMSLGISSACKVWPCWFSTSLSVRSGAGGGDNHGSTLGSPCRKLYVGRLHHGNETEASFPASSHVTLYVFNAPEGCHTAHTQMGRPTHEAPTREYTHKHKHKQTQTK